MNIYELKARLWLWGPYILIGLVVFGVYQLTLRYLEGDPTQVTQEAPERDLTLLADLRAAYLEANGGELLLSRLQTIQLRGTLESGGNEIPFLQLKRRPDQSLLTLMFPDYRLSFGVNGSDVWRRVVVPGRAPEYQRVDAELAEGLQKMGEFFNPVLQVLLSEGFAVEGIATTEWKGAPVVALEFFKDREGIRSTAYIDRETLLLLGVEETLASGQQRRLLYGDYRDVGGIQEAGWIETYVKGELSNRVRVESVEHNIGALAVIFRYPGDESDAAETVVEPVD